MCQVLDWEVQIAAVVLLQVEQPSRGRCGGVPEEGGPAGAVDRDTHQGESIAHRRRQPCGDGGTGQPGSLEGPKPMREGYRTQLHATHGLAYL